MIYLQKIKTCVIHLIIITQLTVSLFFPRPSYAQNSTDAWAVTAQTLNYVADVGAASLALQAIKMVSTGSVNDISPAFTTIDFISNLSLIGSLLIEGVVVDELVSVIVALTTDIVVFSLYYSLRDTHQTEDYIVIEAQKSGNRVTSATIYTSKTKYVLQPSVNLEWQDQTSKGTFWEKIKLIKNPIVPDGAPLPCPIPHPESTLTLDSGKASVRVSRTELRLNYSCVKGVIPFRHLTLRYSDHAPESQVNIYVLDARENPRELSEIVPRLDDPALDF